MKNQISFFCLLLLSFFFHQVLGDTAIVQHPQSATLDESAAVEQAHVYKQFIEKNAEKNEPGLRNTIDQLILLAEYYKMNNFIAFGYTSLGELKHKASDYDSAIYYFNKGIQFYQLSSKRNAEAKAINARGIAYEYKGYYKEAFQDYLDALKIYEELKDKKGIANEYLNIGLIHQYKANYPIAERYFRSALVIYQQLNDMPGIANSYNNLGINANLTGRYQLALTYFQQVLEIDRKEGIPANIAYSLNNIGTALATLNKHNEAIGFFKESVILKKKDSDMVGLANSYCNIGSSYLKLQRFGFAQSYLDSANSISTQFRFTTHNEEIFKTYYELALARKDYKQALTYYQLYQAQKDTLEKEANTIAIQSMESSHQLENAQIKIEEQNDRLKFLFIIRVISIIAIVLLLLLAGYFYKTNQQTKRLNKQLSQKQEDLILAKTKAENSSQVKSKFLSVMSHEIRTPLNAIIGVTDLLRLEINPTLMKENLQVLKSSSQTLLNLINDILDLSKLEFGKSSINAHSFEIRELIDKIKAPFLMLAEQKGLQLVVRIANALPHFVSGDEHKLTQIINNLMSNALKFTNKGQVSLAIDLVSRNNHECRLKFSVSDTGIGIPIPFQQSIFDSFSQATNETHQQFGGTGLGLSISKQLVELLGGTIHVESIEGQGSNFYFEIPFSLKAANYDAPQIDLKESVHFIGKLILIADDNEVNVFVLKQYLQKWGANILVAGNGEEVIQALAAQPIDLILMDIQMPIMDGIEATRRIRNSSDKNNQVPIIAISAANELELKDSMKNEGMNDYITKPFIPEDLWEKASRLL